jgi:hypothetical protein
MGSKKLISTVTNPAAKEKAMTAVDRLFELDRRHHEEQVLVNRAALLHGLHDDLGEDVVDELTVEFNAAGTVATLTGADFKVNAYMEIALTGSAGT